jgi:hypothetical protein
MPHAATQHNPVSMANTARLAATRAASVAWGNTPRHLLSPVTRLRPAAPFMPVTKPRQFFIQGLTLDGRTFRPSDWAERLAGAMSSFRPGGSVGGIGAYIGYSPFCVPRLVGSVKCVIVSDELKDIEPMAWDFVMNFARDNQLQVAEACLMPDGEMGVAPKQSS